MDISDNILIMIISIFTLSLPILIVWLVMRAKVNETNKRTEIILSAIDKNPEIDIEDFIKKTLPPQKSIKEKLLQKLQYGCVCSFLGIVLIVIMVTLSYTNNVAKNDVIVFSVIGSIILAIGIAYFVTYIIGKKMLTKEIENEAKNK